MAESRRMSNAEADAIERSQELGIKAIDLAEKIVSIIERPLPASATIAAEKHLQDSRKIGWPGKNTAERDAARDAWIADYAVHRETLLAVRAQKIALLTDARNEARVLSRESAAFAAIIRGEIDAREETKRAKPAGAAAVAPIP